MQKRRLNIIGCGKVGRTLATLWSRNLVLEIGDILNSDPGNAAKAVTFIQAGKAVSNMTELINADIFMITAPDALIEKLCGELAASGILRKGDIVFHCSGALSSAVLGAAREKGAFTASVHPVMTFAEATEFKGVYCGVEGQEQALSVLSPVFQAIGGEVFHINPDSKSIYHAASVTVSNYLVALLEHGIQLYMKSGLERDLAIKVMQPLAQTAMANVFRVGTVKALTGPIARGDHEIVARQLNALSGSNSEELYRQLGLIALELSKKQGVATDEAINNLADILSGEK